MSSELGLALLVALLWGPTAVWIGYRALRTRRGRLSGSIVDKSGEVPDGAPMADAVATLVDADAYWVCGVCRSVNRPQARRCYACRAAKDAAVRPKPREAAPAAPAASGWTPVPNMTALPPAEQRHPPAPSPLPTQPTLPGPFTSPAPSTRPAPFTLSAPSPSLARSTLPSPVPPVAADPATAAAAMATASLVTAAAAMGTASLVTAAAAMGTVVEGHGSGPVPICPFLGLRDDPFTRFDFPDPGNVCHASDTTSTHDATLTHVLRRIAGGVTGHGRPQLLAAEFQRTVCLTPNHPQCARYPATAAAAPPVTTVRAWPSPALPDGGQPTLDRAVARARETDESGGWPAEPRLPRTAVPSAGAGRRGARTWRIDQPGAADAEAPGPVPVPDLAPVTEAIPVKPAPPARARDTDGVERPDRQPAAGRREPARERKRPR